MVAGENAHIIHQGLNNTKSYSLSTPYNRSQLDSLPVVDLAIISDLVETLPKQQASEWLGLLKNRHSKHIILSVNHDNAEEWRLNDFLALGFKLALEDEKYSLYSYAIENYQFKRDWLNSRFWANPENYDKYRW